MHMILYLIANTGEHVTLQQLADILFVSRSTIIHDVDDVRKSIQKQDLEIVSLCRGLRIQGRESSRRIMLMHLLRLPYVQQYRISEYKDMMSPQDLESLKRMIKDAEKTIEVQREKALSDMESQVAELAMSAAAKILGEDSNDAKNQSLYDEFIEKAGEAHDTESN